MNALGDLYLDWLAAKGCDPDYIANRKSLLNVWVRPVIGHLLVTSWDSHGSLKVIDNARPYLSAARLQDLGSTLSGLRATAHRKRAGGRWLSPTRTARGGQLHEGQRQAGRQLQVGAAAQAARDRDEREGHQRGRGGRPLGVAARRHPHRRLLRGPAGRAARPQPPLAGHDSR
jgi:hypothetical protein